ncbi:response regulator [Dapis sp. BLCC M172]|uniref:response regulator n=1 Tax=Dapis sp. BLCC M172 TaxID=2975281 RepID=UPI003CEC0E33
MNEKNKEINILLAEDNPGDVFIIKEALNQNGSPYKLYQVSDGEEIMKFLHKQENYKNSVRPHLILLDLNLPKKHGFDVLKEIKQDKELKTIPIVVLTSSKSEKDIIESYSLHASCYLTKPVDLPEFMAVIQSLKEFWFRFVQLP